MDDSTPPPEAKTAANAAKPASGAKPAKQVPAEKAAQKAAAAKPAPAAAPGQPAAKPTKPAKPAAAAKSAPDPQAAKPAPAAKPANPAAAPGPKQQAPVTKPAPKPVPPPPKPAKPETKVVVRPLASPAKAKRRHWGLLSSFVLFVMLPIGAAMWYLYERAVDQYASTVAFTVRSEEIASAADILGGLGGTLNTGGSSDADILYEFILSQEMVGTIDEQLGLRALYSRHRDIDPLMSFDPEGTIEDLLIFWRRMVRISYDTGTGLMELRVVAFTPEEARTIAVAIFDESARMINDLSSIAREDATRYAREDLELAVSNVKTAREALTAFRVATQIVDPSADIQGQMGLLNTLQAQLAEALIELDLLNSTVRDGDPRLEQAQLRIQVIEARLADERRKFGVGAPGDTSYAQTIAEFERLAVEREFAEQAYAVTLSNFNGASAEANRKSRYLAAYIRPTLAQKAEFPQRILIIAVVGLFSFLLWAVAALVYYSLNDRR